MTTWAYIERIKGKQKLTDRWAPIKPIYHRFTKGKDKGKFCVVMMNGKTATATTVKDEKEGRA